MEQQEMIQGQEAVHLQAEFPAAGTSINPMEELWTFSNSAGAAPPNQLAGAMQQGE